MIPWDMGTHTTHQQRQGQANEGLGQHSHNTRMMVGHDGAKLALNSSLLNDSLWAWCALVSTMPLPSFNSYKHKYTLFVFAIWVRGGLQDV